MKEEACSVLGQREEVHDQHVGVACTLRSL